MDKDHYLILGVGRDASAEEIRAAYRRLAKRHHPDTSGADDSARFREVREAYEALRRREASSPSSVPITRGPGAAPRTRTRRTAAAPGREPVAGAFELVLTPLEAARGLRVRLAAPVLRTCAACSGTGGSFFWACPLCAGAGQRHGELPFELEIPPGVRSGLRSRIDLGSGVRIEVLLRVEPR